MYLRVVMLLFVALVGAMAPAIVGAQREKGDRKWNPEAAKVKNPAPATPSSVAAGEAIYMKRCRACHGSDATGGNPKDAGSEAPPSLIDRQTVYGPSDGESFHVIRFGAGPAFEMEPWDDRLSETDTWNVVNLLRDLARRSPQQ